MVESLFYYLILVNLIAAGMMAYDKLCAIKGYWRVPEKTLFTLSLIGASPTVLFLMKYLRHKSRKQSFKRQMNLILGVQVVVIVGLLAFYGGG